MTGAAASKTQVVKRMKTSRIIHLATHGLLDYGVKEISFEHNILGAIALVTDKNSNESEDGLLTAKEIMTMSLQTLRQAMLSAIALGQNPIDWAAFTLIGLFGL